MAHEPSHTDPTGKRSRIQPFWGLSQNIQIRVKIHRFDLLLEESCETLDRQGWYTIKPSIHPSTSSLCKSSKTYGKHLDHQPHQMLLGCLFHHKGVYNELVAGRNSIQFLPKTSRRELAVTQT